MTNSEVLTLAKEMVNKHLPDMQVKIEFSRAKTQLGEAIQCRVYGVVDRRRGTIKLSRHWMKLLPREEILDTILHEIAHLKVGVDQGHNHKWKAACREVGARPNRFSTYKVEAAERSYKYRSYCPTCKETHEGGFHRKPLRRYVCTKCRTPIELIPNY